MKQLGLVYVEEKKKSKNKAIESSTWRREKNQKMRQLAPVYEKAKKIEKWGNYI